MPKTLFLYIFKDLLKIFLLASGALAGIMSFGGLLRPLTQHNLAIAQVGQMLGYFMPAMTNYSWPIAALFATTFVYGRMSADNELTACRAAGLSYMSILMPAAMLGMIVTVLSAVFLAYVVPRSFLQAERIVYSNLAQLVAGQIERTQKLNLNSPTQSVTIFARSAKVLEPNPDRPDLQAVDLHDVAIVSYLNDKAKDQPKVPREFYLADNATALIQMPKDADDDVTIFTKMTNGERVPRISDENHRPLVVASFKATDAGPFPLTSPVHETPRFMDIGQLLDLRNDVGKSKKIARSLAEVASADQQHDYEQYLHDELRAGRAVVFAGKDSDRPVTYTIEPPRALAGIKPTILLGNDELTLAGGTIERPGIAFRCESHDGGDFEGHAREIVIRCTPNTDTKIIYDKIEMRDATLNYRDEESTLVSREWNVAVPMPESIAVLSTRTVRDYQTDKTPAGIERFKKIKADVIRQANQIEAELHSRFGFAFSCFSLAIVGAAIGMLFKSGNFVSAFAVSVGPALISIVLTVTGQHISEGVPKDVGKTFHDPLNTGLIVLWSGNVIVAVMGIALYRRLRRT